MLTEKLYSPRVLTSSDNQAPSSPNFFSTAPSGHPAIFVTVSCCRCSREDSQVMTQLFTLIHKITIAMPLLWGSLRVSRSVLLSPPCLLPVPGALSRGQHWLYLSLTRIVSDHCHVDAFLSAHGTRALDFLDVSTRGHSEPRLSIPFPLSASPFCFLLHSEPCHDRPHRVPGISDPYGVCHCSRENVIAFHHLWGLLCSSSWTQCGRS